MTTNGISSDPMTLTRYILTEQQRHPGARGDLSIILSAIATASKAVTSAVRRAGLLNIYGLQGSSNSTGDDQKKLDVIANDIWINSLKHTNLVGVMVSEENEEPLVFPDLKDAKYAVSFDPLDGSSLIDCNGSIGSIWSIFRRRNAGGEPPSAADLLRPGSEMVCAGYVMYGSSTEMVLTFGEGVNVFSYDPTIGEFLLTRQNVKIPEKPQKIYSFNEGNYAAFPAGVRKFIDFCKTGDKPYSLRYVGSMVADLHRTLLYGGIYGYGPTVAAPGGKLRLLYECNPMSFIVEQAGGAATTGTTRILDLVPTKIHQRAPIYIGCKRDVELVMKYIAETPEDGAAKAATS